MIQAALMCLAMNIYHEARGEPLVGKVAVGQVVMNRVESPQFPNNICEVVHQGKYHNGVPVLHKCQFSWWCDGKPDVATNEEQWEKAMHLADMIYFGYLPDLTEGSLYYHSTAVDPYWSDSYNETVTINNHTFYR